MERESDILEGLESERRVARAPRPIELWELAAIFAGGFLGAIARAALAQSVQVPAGAWPWAIFSVNLLGAAVLGYVIAHDQQRDEPSIYRLAFIAIGFCGALTTFSTLMAELLAMIEASRWALASGYGGASIAGGLAAVFLAGAIGRRGRSAG